ncbi:MAG: hypothetical protein Q9187_003222 [Circinaria calcarea]
MSGGQPSDEVAEDYKLALQDLITNDIYGIHNLTVVAKEYTEYAPAISKALEEHIRKAPPDRKLPAIYVLDSLAKNIGTPYTLFLGHNLYTTFMDAYSLVGPSVRKKLDEMLQTWKTSVPGSLDKRPVFPPEITKRIESALIQAKTVALQQQQQQHRGQQEMLRRRGPAITTPTPYRATPTPPQGMARYPPPTSQGYIQHPHVPNGQTFAQTHSPYPQHLQTAPPQDIQSPYQQLAQLSNTSNGYLPPLVNVDSLHRDIEILISTAKAEFASNIQDIAVQTRLKALLDLQSILRSQQLPPNQIQLIRDQVAQLSATTRPAPPPPAVTSASTYSLNAYSANPPLHFQYPQQSITALPQTPAPPVLPSASSLAELLASAAKSKAMPAPQPAPQTFNPMTALQQSQPPLPPVSNDSPPLHSTTQSLSLMDQLRAAGLLRTTASTPVTSSVNSAPTPFSYAPPPPSVNPLPLRLPDLVKPPLREVRNDIQLTSASLRIPRPHLISKLYEARPNQCSTCGKRFLYTDEDRNKKARHLDWHFRTNQRLADSAKRGQSRSWYVDELEWIKSRANEEDGSGDSPSGTQDSKAVAAAAASKNDPQTKFIPVPSDNDLASLPCPICQEKFDITWNDDAQDFVWTDAVKIGSRVYHASCHAELKQDEANTPLRILTPDSVLGKRKAEVSSRFFWACVRNRRVNITNRRPFKVTHRQ